MSTAGTRRATRGNASPNMQSSRISRYTDRTNIALCILGPLVSDDICVMLGLVPKIGISVAADRLDPLALRRRSSRHSPFTSSLGEQLCEVCSIERPLE